jgi:hypothetical protein
MILEGEQEIIVYEPLSTKAETHIKKSNLQKANSMRHYNKGSIVHGDLMNEDLLGVMKPIETVEQNNLVQDFEMMESYLQVEDGKSPENFSAADYRVRAGTLSGLISHLVCSEYCGKDPISHQTAHIHMCNPPKTNRRRLSEYVFVDISFLCHWRTSIKSITQKISFLLI